MFETLYSRPELQQVPGAKHIREEQVIYGQLFNQQLLNIHDELKQRYSTELNLVYNDIKHHRVKQARQKLAQLKGWPTKQPKMNILWFQIHYSECNMKLSKLERSLKKPATPFTHAGLNHSNYLKKVSNNLMNLHLHWTQ